MSRLKLSAGGSAYVSKCLRFECPVCKKTFLIHPDRWLLHLQQCLQGAQYEYILALYLKEKNEITKQNMEILMLDFHDSTLN